jgi:hypothetical protein
MIEIIRPSAAAESVVEPMSLDQRTMIGRWLRRRAVALGLIVLTAVATLAYTLLWGPLFGHADWITPGDLWGTFHTAQMVSWGDIGDVYSVGGGLVSLPGISIVLAPAALLINHLHLSIGFPYGLAHPTGWLVLGPYEAVVGAVVLVPLDSLAEHLELGRRQRMVLSVCEAIVLWPVLGIWGHPEDPLAMAFATWALLAALQNRWRPAGWLFGLAVVMQPLVLLMAPILFVMVPVGRRFAMAARSLLPAAVSVAIPLAQSWKATTTALLKQPNFPAIDHPTPWLFLAPVLSKPRPGTVKHFGQVTLPGGLTRFTTAVVHTVWGETVAAGPGRLIAIGLAVGLALYVYRRRPSPQVIVWLCCVALGLRCVFEAVMDPYYLWPPLALALLLAMRSWPRFVLAVGATALCTWWSYHHIGPWAWWAPVVGLLALSVVAAMPARFRRAAVDAELERPARMKSLVGAAS